MHSAFHNRPTYCFKAASQKILVVKLSFLLSVRDEKCPYGTESVVQSSRAAVEPLSWRICGCVLKPQRGAGEFIETRFINTFSLSFFGNLETGKKVLTVMAHISAGKFGIKRIRIFLLL